jgi:hypothetical protein
LILLGFAGLGLMGYRASRKRAALAAVASAPDDAPMMHRDHRVDQVAAKGPKAS